MSNKTQSQSTGLFCVGFGQRSLFSPVKGILRRPDVVGLHVGSNVPSSPESVSYSSALSSLLESSFSLSSELLPEVSAIFMNKEGLTVKTTSSFKSRAQTEPVTVEGTRHIFRENLLHLYTAHHVSRRKPSRSDQPRKRPIYHV
ncbi:hypothetical protein J6590_092144 [Homalodisca vitripennis]|nr:hypothetical protein J6590_092144 [Homalodisca vitripennis]